MIAWLLSTCFSWGYCSSWSRKSTERNLGTAYAQAGEYCNVLLEKQRPHYIMVSDSQNFQLHDLDERATVDTIWNGF